MGTIYSCDLLVSPSGWVHHSWSYRRHAGTFPVPLSFPFATRRQVAHIRRYGGGSVAVWYLLYEPVVDRPLLAQLLTY